MYAGIRSKDGQKVAIIIIFLIILYHQNQYLYIIAMIMILEGGDQTRGQGKDQGVGQGKSWKRGGEGVNDTERTL